MIKMVVCFAFDTALEKIVLIQKNRPSWQAGKLNGVGGKLEPDEFPRDAASREFLEETGVNINPLCWTHFTTMTGLTENLEEFQVVYYYTTLFPNEIECVTSVTDEKVFVLPISLDQLAELGVSNLAWLVAAALDNIRNPVFTMDVVYRK